MFEDLTATEGWPGPHGISSTVNMISRENRVSSWRTHRGRGVCVDKVRSMLRKRVQVWGRNPSLGIVGADISEPNIVNQKDDDVRATLCKGNFQYQ